MVLGKTKGAGLFGVALGSGLLAGGYLIQNNNSLGNWLGGGKHSRV